MENAKSRNTEQIEIKTKELLCSSVLLSFSHKKNVRLIRFFQIQMNNKKNKTSKKPPQQFI